MAEKVTHIDQLEDLPLLYGSAGFKKAVALLNDLINNKSKILQNVAVKFDGAPSIIAGRDPESGKFFVGTKGVFAKTPKMLYTLRDIKKYYSEQPQLATKLAEALLYLKPLGWTKIYQGEFLFSSNTKNLEEIDGQPFVTFKPQLITYATPANTEPGASIQRAKVGFVWHTSYSGKTIADLKQSQGVDPTELGSSNNVWQITNIESNRENIVNQNPELVDVVKKLAQTKIVSIDRLISNKTLQSLIMMYVNKLVGENKDFGSAPMDELVDYVTNKIMADADTERKRISRQEKLDEILDHLQLHQQGFALLQKLYATLTALKMQIMKKVKQFGGLDAYLRSGEKLQPFSHEGLSIYDKQGDLVKFIDRQEFSRLNRILPKDFR